MTLEAIQQSAKTIIESTYEYETALQKKNDKKAERAREYMLKVCSNLKRMIQEERNDV